MARRHRTSGFVLMDALIAFAITALAVAAVLSILPSASGRQTDRLLRYQAAEFAYSVMEEYRETFPIMPAFGEDPSGWSWEIKESPADETATAKLVEITVVAWRRDRPKIRATLQGTVARRQE